MRPFPVLWDQLRWPRGYQPLASVPWAMLSPHEARAKRNHCGQSLEVLASRFGLSAAEIVAIIDGLDPISESFWDAGHSDPVFSDTLLRQRVAEFESTATKEVK